MKIKLPLPKRISPITVEESMLMRRSVRSFTKDPLTWEEISMLLWSGGGAVEEEGFKRTVPSAGATYPLEYYCLFGDDSIASEPKAPAGIYRYKWEDHSLELHINGDRRKELALASLNQKFISEAPFSIVIAAEYGRTTDYYGERGYRYVHFEAGHAGQNIYLMATSLGLGTVAVGAFDDDTVKKLLGIPYEPLYIFPVGRPKEVKRRSFERLWERYAQK
ncbi:MAG: SagB/ThcOx family dehydrogenase [Fervidicoccaceae archaeon]